MLVAQMFVAFISLSRVFASGTDPRVTSSVIHRAIGDPARVTRPFEPRELKVVTWNIEYGTRFQRVAEELRHLDADVYLLQEVDVFCRRSGNRNIAKDLADAIGGVNWVFAGEFQELGESSGRVPALTGQAILSRYSIADAEPVPFRAQAWARWHLNPVQPRRGGRLVLRASIAGVRFYNAHLESGANRSLRRKQLDDMLAEAARDPSAGATLLAGDFNQNPIAGSFLSAMTTAGFTNALQANAGERTGVYHRYPVDWIFVRHLRPMTGEVIRVDHASDHYPVVATLDLDARSSASPPPPRL